MWNTQVAGYKMKDFNAGKYWVYRHRQGGMDSKMLTMSLSARSENSRVECDWSTWSG